MSNKNNVGNRNKLIINSEGITRRLCKDKTIRNNIPKKTKRVDLSTENKNSILIQKISRGNNEYGKLVYSINSDKIIFENRFGETISLCNNREFILKDKKGKLDNSIIKFYGIWKNGIMYNENCIVKDQNDYGSLYISKKIHNSRCPPNKDSINWSLFISNGFTFRGIWEPLEVYKYNHCVIDKQTSNLYICIKSSAIGDLLTDNTIWSIFIPNLSNYIKNTDTELTNDVNSFYLNNVEKMNNKEEKNKRMESYDDKLMEDIYEDLLIPEDSCTIPELENLPKLNNTVNNCQSIPTFFSVFTNGACCYKFNKKLGMSVFDVENCCYGHKSPSKMYSCKKIYLRNDNEIILPLLLVAKNDTGYYEQTDSLISIKKHGYYRVTYNIAYHGSIYDLLSKVNVVKQDKQDTLLYSVNKSNNRLLPYEILTCDSLQLLPGDDKDKYYEYDGTKSETLDKLTQYINHTFYLPIKKESNNKKNYFSVQLTLKINKYNRNKVIYIHPIKTWISIERLDNYEYN
jgi:hypothetical protein